ncbi:MAG: glycosyltransferase [Pararhodobacter sp.]
MNHTHAIETADPSDAQTHEPVIRLVAVVVTFNRKAQLERTLAALLAEPAQNLAAVLVVDNASDDGTGAWLDGLDAPRLCVLRMPRNLGGAGGFEAGMRHAIQVLDPDWIVVMDDDAHPEPGALAAFHAADLAGWDAAAAAVYHPDGRICQMNRPTLNPFWHFGVLLRTALGGGRGAFHLGARAYSRQAPVRAVDGASFVGLFLSRGAIERAGYPDAALFVYGDDAIYTLGLTAAGERIGFFPAIRFSHDSETLGADDGRFRPLWKVYYYHRNLLILYRMAAGWLFWPVLLVVLPRWLMRLRSHRGERRAFLRLLWDAVRDGLRRRVRIDHASVLARAGTPPGKRQPRLID